MDTARALREMYDRLLAHFGPQHWWPGRTPFEVMVGAVLTQNTNWKNVARAIENLRRADVLEPKALLAVPFDRLAQLIQPAGYFRVKARRLLNLLQWLDREFQCDLDAMFATPPDELRERLMAVNGIGPETCDSILLYAGRIPTFVVDAYTCRVIVRHGLIAPEEVTYEAVKALFEDHLERDERLFNEYHALLVAAGKTYCRPRPRCLAGCPLEAMLDPAAEVREEAAGPHPDAETDE
jgi:endonuclease-3 related protein